MRRRSRRRARASTSDGGVAPTTQHMARVNVEDRYWTAFRMEAVRRNTSVAAYLGVLVRREAARMRPHDVDYDAGKRVPADDRQPDDTEATGS